MAHGWASRTYKDYDGETSNVTFKFGDLTAVNFATKLSDITALFAALDGVSLGRVMGYFYGNKNESVDRSNASSEQADREAKALLTYRDVDTGKLYRIEIPCIDKTLRIEARPGYYYTEEDPSASETAIGTLVTAFEALVKAEPVPGDFNDVEVVSIINVGRNI